MNKPEQKFLPLLLLLLLMMMMMTVTVTVTTGRQHENKLNWVKKKHTPNKVVFKVFWLMQPHIRKNLKSLGLWSKV